jgi:hypothetical protein
MTVVAPIKKDLSDENTMGIVTNLWEFNPDYLPYFIPKGVSITKNSFGQITDVTITDRSLLTMTKKEYDIFLLAKEQELLSSKPEEINLLVWIDLVKNNFGNFKGGVYAPIFIPKHEIEDIDKNLSYIYCKYTVANGNMALPEVGEFLDCGKCNSAQADFLEFSASSKILFKIVPDGLLRALGCDYCKLYSIICENNLTKIVKESSGLDSFFDYESAKKFYDSVTYKKDPITGQFLPGFPLNTKYYCSRGECSEELEYCYDKYPPLRPFPPVKFDTAEECNEFCSGTPLWYCTNPDNDCVSLYNDELLGVIFLNPELEGITGYAKEEDCNSICGADSDYDEDNTVPIVP